MLRLGLWVRSYGLEVRVRVKVKDFEYSII